MKIFTEKVKYAIASLFELAKIYNQDSVMQKKEISKNQNIPESFLEQLLLILKRHNLVESIRGAKGGYKLKQPPEKISIFDIVKALEGNISIIGEFDKSEVLNDYWQNVEKDFIKLLNDNLGSFVNKENKLKKHLFFNI
ncbi:MAG: Rrf2 family transcriptional regulator [Spirochaetes bacterium]|nr:Rrf2 family transcriptional regulator [Spirochaetota bacterium]